MKAIILAVGLLFPVSTIASSSALVPERFVATWAGSPTSCGSDTDDMVLRLAQAHISYWESDGPIRSAVVLGDEIALIVELSGEGETWLATAKFELSPDGRMLIDNTTIPGKEIVRYRCSRPVGVRPNDSFKPTPLRGAA